MVPDGVLGPGRQCWGVARLWGEVRLLHPAVDAPAWNAAVGHALADCTRPRPAEEYAVLVRRLLDALDDPLCALVEQPASSRPLRVAGGGALVDLAAASGVEPGPAAVKRLAASFRAARERAATVVVDLRGAGWWAGRALPAALGELLPAGAALPLPVERSRLVSGWPSVEADASGGAYAGYVLRDAETLAGTGATPGRLVVVIGPGSGMAQRAAAALAAAGWAEVFHDGPPAHPGPTTRLALPGGLVARVRVGELRRDGGAGLPATVRALPRHTVDGCLVWPRDFAAGVTRALPPASRRDVAPLVDDLPDGEVAPALMAAVRCWTAVRELGAYRDAAACRLDRLLVETADALYAAGHHADPACAPALEALCRLAAGLGDAHARIHLDGRDALETLIGEAAPDVRLRLLDGDVAAVAAGSAPRCPPGSVVEAIDGRPIAERVARLRPLVPSAAPVARDLVIARFLLAGARGTQVRLRLRPAGDGPALETVLERDRPLPPPWCAAPSPGAGPPDRVDLAVLAPGDVDACAERIRERGGAILDLRRYPSAAALALPERLAGPRSAATAHARPELRGAGPATRSVLRLHRHVGGDGGEPADAALILLVDATTASRGEYLALLLRAAVRDAVVVGQRTAGMLGPVTTVRLAPRLTATFTGQATAGPSAEPLHGIGLEPDHAVPLTLQGLGDGRDEQLEEAQRVLDARRAAPPAAPPLPVAADAEAARAVADAAPALAVEFRASAGAPERAAGLSATAALVAGLGCDRALEAQRLADAVASAARSPRAAQALRRLGGAAAPGPAAAHLLLRAAGSADADWDALVGRALRAPERREAPAARQLEWRWLRWLDGGPPPTAAPLPSGSVLRDCPFPFTWDAAVEDALTHSLWWLTGFGVLAVPPEVRAATAPAVEAGLAWRLTEDRPAGAAELAAARAVLGPPFGPALAEAARRLAGPADAGASAHERAQRAILWCALARSCALPPQPQPLPPSRAELVTRAADALARAVGGGDRAVGAAARRAARDGGEPLPALRRDGRIVARARDYDLAGLADELWRQAAECADLTPTAAAAGRFLIEQQLPDGGWPGAEPWTTAAAVAWLQVLLARGGE